MFDCAIVGAGPAGLSAAICLRQLGREFIWFGSAAMSDKVRASELIGNYPGLPAVTGGELAALFEEHRRQMDLPVVDKQVTQILRTGEHWSLLAENEVTEARTVVLALGVGASATLPGEQELLGRGVSYCATCDGALYRGRRIGVLCTSQRFAHEVGYLAGLAGKTYLFPSRTELTEVPGDVERVGQPLRSVNGKDRLESVSLADGTVLELDGLFCMRDQIAPAALLSELKTEKGHIPVDRAMATGLPGCFACGDCTGTPYQIAKAVGEGNVAAHSVVRYLAEQLMKK